jgi:hypothetical protein
MSEANPSLFCLSYEPNLQKTAPRCEVRAAIEFERSENIIGLFSDGF